MEKNYFISKEQYQLVAVAWKKLSDAQVIYTDDIIVYNALRSKPINNGFTETKKPNKIRGNDPWFAFNTALKLVKWKYTERTGGFGRLGTYEENKKAFEVRYGIPMPDGFIEYISGNGHGT